MPVAMVWIWFLTFLLKINTNITRLETGNKDIADALFKTVKGYPGERFHLCYLYVCSYQNEFQELMHQIRRCRWFCCFRSQIDCSSLCIKLGDVDGFVVSEAKLTVSHPGNNSEFQEMHQHFD